MNAYSQSLWFAILWLQSQPGRRCDMARLVRKLAQCHAFCHPTTTQSCKVIGVGVAAHASEPCPMPMPGFELTEPGDLCD